MSKRYTTGVRLTAEQRARAEAIAAVTGGARAAVLAHAVDVGLDAIAKRIHLTESGEGR